MNFRQADRHDSAERKLFDEAEATATEAAGDDFFEQMVLLTREHAARIMAEKGDKPCSD